jgi:hypothetical protein
MHSLGGQYGTGLYLLDQIMLNNGYSGPFGAYHGCHAYIFRHRYAIPLLRMIGLPGTSRGR